MGVILRSVLARKRDWIAEHGAEPTTLRVDDETNRQLHTEILDYFHLSQRPHILTEDQRREYRDMLSLHADAFRVYDLRIEIVDAPEWLEVL